MDYHGAEYAYMVTILSVIKKIFLGKNRMPVISQERKVVSITCAFCRGSGNDPFGIMSYLSTCCVCGGRGIVTTSSPYSRCAHCSGTGAVKTLTCTACMGKGVLPITTEDTRICPVCCGSGDDPSASAMYCLCCRGRGYVSSK
jgi:DnaJ-class molecular chaperone